MNEPTVTSCAVGNNTVACFSFVGALLSLDVYIFMGAFVGATVFVMAKEEPKITKRVVYFFASIAIGVMCARAVDAWFPNFPIPDYVGAFLSAALMITILNRYIKKGETPNYSSLNNAEVPSYSRSEGDKNE